MSESETEEEKILGHLRSAMELATTAQQEKIGMFTGGKISPEYTCLRSMMLDPQNPTMWNSMALVYLMTGRLTDAQDAIDRSLDIDSGNAWTWSIWGDLLLLKGNNLESERAYRMAMEMGSSDPHILRQLLRLFSDRGNNLEALRLLEQLLPQCPDDQSLWDLYTECIVQNNRLLRNNP